MVRPPVGSSRATSSNSGADTPAPEAAAIAHTLVPEELSPALFFHNEHVCETPEPSGERRQPPPILKTAIGLDDGNGPVLALHLLDDEETAAVAVALEKLGWNVEVGYSPFDALAVLVMLDEPPDVIFTDDPGVLREWTSHRPTVVVVVENRESAVSGAWAAGADWVVTRPLNLDNPLRPV